MSIKEEKVGEKKKINETDEIEMRKIKDAPSQLFQYFKPLGP